VGVLNAVCVDLYSTLVHESPGNPFVGAVATVLGCDDEAWRAAYRQAGRLSMSGAAPTMADRVQAACDIAGRAIDRDRVEAAVAGQMPVFYANLSLDPFAYTMLDGLRETGWRLALVSNASRYSESVLDTMGLRARFDAIVLSCYLGVLKPDPAIYLAAAKALSTEPGQCAFVGDGGDNELAGARGVGMRTVLVERGLPHTDTARLAADTVVACLSAVAGAVSDLSSKG